MEINSKQSLLIKLYEIGVVQFGDFLLKSGQRSSIYLNLRKVISYPNLLKEISELLYHTVFTNHYDLVCGVPYTALPFATYISFQYQIPLILRRKEKKEYGTKEIIEGVYHAGAKCLVIEDVITSGGSLQETIQDIESTGICVTDAIALIDREQGGKAMLTKHCNVHTVFTLTEIFHGLLHHEKLPENERTIIKSLLARNT